MQHLTHHRRLASNPLLEERLLRDPHAPQQPLLRLVVAARRPLTPRVECYHLRSTTGEELPLVKAGSYLSIPVQLADQSIAWRDYAICSNPLQRDEYQIAVLLEENGRGGSQYIHQHFVEGAIFFCALPKPYFQLHADASPSILIAAGIGIAPLMAIAQTLANRGRRFTLHYAGRNKNEMAFAAELSNLFPRQVHFYPADEHLRINLLDILSAAPANAFYYVCAPYGLIQAMENDAQRLRIPRDNVQYALFNPPSRNKPVMVELARRQQRIPVNAEQSLLAALRDAGVSLKSGCCVGECATCAVKMLAGVADHRDHVLSDAAKSRGMICLCVSRAQSETIVLDL